MIRFFLSGSIVLTAISLSCNHLNSICVDVGPNATVQRIAFDSSARLLYVSFYNNQSYCTGTGEKPYRANLLTVSMHNFTGTYSHKETDGLEMYSPPPGPTVLFDGDLGCYDSCVIALPSLYSNYSLTYIFGHSSGITLALDTSGIVAAKFKLWNYE